MPQASLEEVPVLARTSEGRAREVEQLIAPALADMGYEIVRILLSGERRPKLQVMIERRDGAALLVEDCASASRAVGAILDVEDPIRGSYTLEVSSPGIDRPLTRLSDFERFAGFEAKVEMRMPIDGRRRFRGPIIGVEGEAVVLETEAGRQVLAFMDMTKAKLVLTDALIAAHQQAKDQ